LLEKAAPLSGSRAACIHTLQESVPLDAQAQENQKKMPTT